MILVQAMPMLVQYLSVVGCALLFAVYGSLHREPWTPADSCASCPLSCSAPWLGAAAQKSPSHNARGDLPPRSREVPVAQLENVEDPRTRFAELADRIRKASDY